MDELTFKNLDAKQIKEYQQNRYPHLFIDKIVQDVPGKYSKGYKNFSYNEWFFPAHFEDEPNVPGFVQIEALAQTFLMSFLTFPEYKGSKTAFIKANNVLFKKKIIPGDRLDIVADLKSFRHGVAIGSVKSFVDDEPACSADFIIAIPDVVKPLAPKGK